MVEWVSNEAPYRCYITTNDISNSFLDCLRVKWANIPVTKDGRGRYVMGPELLKSWRLTESLIYGTINCLTSMRVCEFNLELKTPRTPSTYGYASAWSSEDELKCQIMKARFAFKNALAFLAFLLTGSAYVTPSNHRAICTPVDGAWPPWAKVAVRDYGIHPAWLQMLLRSDIANFECSRVGGYIRADRCTFLNYVRWMLPRRIPLVFVWPLNDPRYGVEQIAGQLGRSRFGSIIQLSQSERAALQESFNADPNPLDLDKAIRIVYHPSATHFFSQNEYSPPSSFSSQPNSDTPQIQSEWDSPNWGVKLSTAQPEEPTGWLVRTKKPASVDTGLVHWKVFLDNMEKTNAKLAATEAEKERSQRLQKKKHADAFQLTRTAQVFIWEEDDSGVVRRVRMARAEAKDAWEFYGNEQKVYNSFKDTWEIIPAKAPNDCGYDDEDWDQEDDNIVMFSNPPPPDVVTWKDWSTIVQAVCEDKIEVWAIA